MWEQKGDKVRLHTFEEGARSHKIKAQSIKDNDDKAINSWFGPTL